MRNKCLKAVEKYLERKDYDVIDDMSGAFDFVVKDGRSLIFVDVYVQDNFNEPEFSRAEIEESMFDWIMMNDFSDCSLRYDVIIVRPMNGRAMLKHHISALSFGDM